MPARVEQLKELLFDQESRALSALEARLAALSDEQAKQHAERLALAQRIDDLFARTGTEERLRDSVATVLDGALRDAEVQKHDQMARAVAPLVVRTIKTELKNSQDEMVEAFYPIMGRLVKAYVASAVKDLTDQINRKIEGNALVLRLRSLASGRSVAELALAESQHLEVDELFLVRRGSGELVRRWPENNASSESDIHLASVLTAINEFAAEGFREGGGNLRTFEVDDFRVFLRGSAAFLLVAKCRGVPPPGAEAVFDEEFLRTIERNRDSLSTPLRPLGQDGATATGAVPANLLPPLATAINARLTEKHAALESPARTITPVRLLLAMILLPLLAWLGWTSYQAYVTDTVRQAARHVIDGTPDLLGYPTTLDVDGGGRIVTIGGLTPSLDVKRDVIEKLRREFPDGSVIDRLNVVSGGDSDAVAQIARLRMHVAGIEDDAIRQAVRGRVDLAARRLGGLLPEFGRLEGLLPDGPPRAGVRTAREQAAKAVASLDELRRQLGVRGPGGATSDRLLALLREATGEVRQAAGHVAGGGPAAAGAQTLPTDPLAAAELLSVETERLQLALAAATVEARTKPVPLPEPTPRDRLEQWIRLNAIFFSDGTDYRSPDQAEAKLDQAAQLIKRAGGVVRVIGSTDETGVAARNVALAAARADKVIAALVARGVPRDRLIALSRTYGQDPSQPAVSSRSNRRAEFQMAFEGETD